MSELTHTDVLKYVGIFCFSLAVIGILLYFFVFKKKKTTPPSPPSICKQNSDCTTGFVCSTDNVCVSGNCNIENPCQDPTQICQNYNCVKKVTCKQNSDCSTGFVCSTDNVCVSGNCNNETPCQEPNQICQNYNCIQKVTCKKNSDCATGFVCGTNGICVTGNCNNETPCQDPSLICQNYNCVPDSDKCSNHGKRQNGVCICNPYASKAQDMTVLYKGKDCQYSDNDNCKGQGIVDDNGKCTWVAGKVFPRCAGLQNPSEQDYTKLLCDRTINPAIFTTYCKPNNGINTVYGCPINENLYAWKPYIGLSCHYPGEDKRDCLGGATTRRFNGTAGTESEYNAYDLCQIDNLKNITGAIDGFDFSKVDIGGLPSTVVSTFPLVREDHAGGDDSWGASTQPYGNVSDNIITDIDNECDFGPSFHHKSYEGIRAEPTFIFGNSYTAI
jgi:hypothetical protein